MDILTDQSFLLFSEKASCCLPPPWWKCTNKRILLTNALCWVYCFLPESKFYNLGLGFDKGRQQSKVILLFTSHNLGFWVVFVNHHCVQCLIVNILILSTQFTTIAFHYIKAIDFVWHIQLFKIMKIYFYL